VASPLVLDVRDKLAWALGPVGAPPLRIALQVGLTDRIHGFLAEVPHEVPADHRGLALALVGPAFAPLHLAQDLRDVLLSHTLERMGAGGEPLLSPIGRFVPDGLSPVLRLAEIVGVQGTLELPLPADAEAHLPLGAALALEQLEAFVGDVARGSQGAALSGYCGAYDCARSALECFLTPQQTVTGAGQFFGLR
jgi:hypothetical protein